MPFTFHAMVEIRKIDITEQLRRKIPDRQATIFFGIEEALVPRQAVPFFTVASDDAPICGVAEHHFLQQIFYQVIVQILAPSQLLFSTSATGILVENLYKFV